MIEKQKIYAIGAVVVLLGVGIGAFILLSDDTIEGDFTVKDMRGRSVGIPADVEKVVCISAGALRFVSYFDMDKVVGVDSYDKGSAGSMANYNLAIYRAAFPDQLDDATDIGGISSFQEIMDTKADVIFTTTEAPATLDDLQTKTGIPVVGLRAEGYFDIDQINTFYKQLELIGKVLGMESRATELAAGISGLLTELETYKLSVTTAQLKTSYICGLMTGMAGDFYKTTGKYIPFSSTCALNVMPDISNMPYITDDIAILLADPEYMFVDIANYDSCMNTLKTNKTVLAGIDALEKGNVYTLLPYKYYNTNYESEIINCFAVGSILCSEVYDYDLEDKANEIIQLFFPKSTLTYSEFTTLIGQEIGKIAPSAYGY